MIAYGTIFLPTSTAVTCSCLMAVLIQDTMIHVLFEGVIFTMMVVIALLDAILEVSDFKRIHKVPLALVRLMAIMGWAS